AQAHDAALSLADLRSYRPEWVQLLSRDFGNCTLHELPPSGQGIATLIALGILDHLDIRQRPIDHPATQHLMIEAMKLAFADVHAHIADPRFMHMAPADMLSDAYLAERALLIDPQRAQTYTSGHAPAGGTVHISTA